MEKVVKNVLILIAIIIVMGVIAGFFVPKVVSPNGHIYKNETYPHNFRPTLQELSDRASYLDTIHFLTPDAKEAVGEMILDAEEDGMCLVVYSSWRSPEQQRETYNWVKENRPEKINSVAKPYRSEHQTGRAVDFVGCPMKNGKRDDSAERLELKKDFKELPEYKWLQNNAHKYGFEQSYTVENQDKTGISPEPWHWFYIK